MLLVLDVLMQSLRLTDKNTEEQIWASFLNNTYCRMFLAIHKNRGNISIFKALILYPHKCPLLARLHLRSTPTSTWWQNEQIALPCSQDGLSLWRSPLCCKLQNHSQAWGLLLRTKDKSHQEDESLKSDCYGSLKIQFAPRLGRRKFNLQSRSKGIFLTHGNWRNLSRSIVQQSKMRWV